MARILKRNLAKDYGLTLSWRFAEVEFLGLPKLKDERVHRLEHIYVPLRLCRDWKDRFQADKTLHVPQVLQQHRRLMVLGDPGSGKSTLVKVLTYAFGEAKDNAYKRACGPLVPIPIILRLHNTRKWRTYRDMLRDFTATLDEDIREAITAEWLIEHLTAGRAILMIDGVDEVGSRAEREHLRDEIILPLLEHAPEAWMFITSRVVGYDEVPFEFKIPGEEIHSIIEGGFECIYVAPFNDEEIRQFVTRWYALRETFPERQEEGIKSLIQALTQNDRVKRLANNPQLLTLIALVHRVTANLPSGRVELYDKIVEAYLETIQVFRKLGTPARLDEMKRWLANVGWRMQLRRDEGAVSKEAVTGAKQGDELLVSRPEIKSWLVEAIERERGAEEAPIAAERFLDYVARRSGLLVPRGPEEFSFVHLTFQEYFAAFALRGRVRNFEQLAEDCARLVESRHWHETLNLLFEMLTEFPGACDDLFEAILSRSVKSDTDAEFISMLLPDEQSGLSFPNQARAAEFVLNSVCANANTAVLNHLRQLGPLLRNKWITEPLKNRLQTARPVDLPEHFFVVGENLVDEWQELVCCTMKNRSFEPWAAEQIVIMTLTCRDLGALRWASERLVAPQWVSPLNETHETLVDELLPMFLKDDQPSVRHVFLTHTGLISALSNIHLLRLSLLDAPFNKAKSSKLSKLRARRWRDSLFSSSLWRRITPISTLDTRWKVVRLLVTNPFKWNPTVRTFVWRAVLTRDEGLAPVLSEDVLKSEKDSLTRLGIGAVLALDRERRFSQTAIEALTEALSANDDWTRLMVIYCLISLGEGTYQRLCEMNHLLDLATEKPEGFTFPKELGALTNSSEFMTDEFPRTMRLLFWHRPGHPMLNPQWFDSDRKESEFFRASPPDLLTIAANMIYKVGW